MPRGTKPDPTKGTSRNAVHQYKAAELSGWQHGEVPAPPDGLRSSSVTAWNVWFASWWAFFWTPADLPGLEVMVELYDKVRRGELGPEKLTPYLDRYGVTEKGRQDNRWAPPKKEAPAAPDVPDEVAARRQERAEHIA